MAVRVEERLDYGSNVPEARRIIGLMAQALRRRDEAVNGLDYEKMAEHLERAHGMLTRRKPVKVAPRNTRPVTDEVKATVRRLSRENPNWSMQQIAVVAETNSGRVSEILNGLR